MATYKTPGVYVEEISTLPPSVAGVSTAIPAFIGYTEKHDAGAGVPVVKRIDTFLEFETLFGRAPLSNFTITAEASAEDETAYEVVGVAKDAVDFQFLLYYSLNLYFKNGGGSCYVVSIGDYDSTPGKAHYSQGLQELEKEDEPTLILLTDAVNLDATDYYDLCKQSLAQCKKLGDRFSIFDVLEGTDKVEPFRNGIGSNYLMYGAAYTPYLQSTINYRFDDNTVKINGLSAASSWSKEFAGSEAGNGIIVAFTGSSETNPSVKIINGDAADAVTFERDDVQLTIRGVNGKTGSAIATAWESFADAGGFSINLAGDGSGNVAHTNNAFVDLENQSDSDGGVFLNSILSSNTSLYNQIRKQLMKQRVVMPPSSAIAGIYASVDRNRGVWKAPANVSVSGVIGPVVKITHAEQERLNVNPAAGKSINAIRAFAGKGTMVWGARTLAGNDNEWRYISVRRLFNMIEESTQKATSFAVFEPNDATTWLKVKAMIESYLYGLWEQGALAGPTPESAYFVNVGLGKTMTTQDILEGRMNVEIGIAAVRPAEFIILRFSHKLQEA
ncbi:MAG: phage tail sheath family protein [Calditrichaeota bacterium]|nr:MAG: phage tail sheath family protein [Calditrichota bacterium]